MKQKILKNKLEGLQALLKAKIKDEASTNSIEINSEE